MIPMQGAQVPFMIWELDSTAQGSNPGLLHCRQILYHLSYYRSPRILQWDLPLLQGIFLTQESNQGLLHCKQILYQLSYQGKPVVKNPPSNARDLEMWVWSLGREDLLEKGMATYSSILAWRIPWTEEPARLQSIGSHRVGHDWSDLARMQILKVCYAVLCYTWPQATSKCE